jgi:hypothetical protein
MSCWDNEYHVILHEGFNTEIFPLFRTFDERQLNLSRQESFEHRICIPAASRNPDLRVCPAKSRHQRWQEVLTDGLGSSQSEFAGMLSKRLRDRGKGFVRELLHFLRIGQQRLSAGSQRDVPSSAIKQGQAKLIFKSFDLLSDCGLREQQFLCGTAEIQMLCDRPEYSYAEIFYHDPIRLLFRLNSSQVGGCMMITVSNVKNQFSLCWLRAGNRIQGLARDCTSNQRGEYSARQNDRKEMPLPGKFYRHQSRH